MFKSSWSLNKGKGKGGDAMNTEYRPTDKELGLGVGFDRIRRI